VKEEIEGGEEEEAADRPGMVGLATVAARKRWRRHRAEVESTNDVRGVSLVPAVRRCGSRLAWIRGERLGSDANPGTAKYNFGPGGGALTRVDSFHGVTRRPK
jgi:hypothetical protein